MFTVENLYTPFTYHPLITITFLIQSNHLIPENFQY